jgi:hypothetical protein
MRPIELCFVKPFLIVVMLISQAKLTTVVQHPVSKILIIVIIGIRYDLYHFASSTYIELQ